MNSTPESEPHPYQRLRDIAVTGVQQQGVDGAMPAGHNGPYYHDETVVRNTAHWAFTWCKLYEHERYMPFRDAAERAAKLLHGEKYRPNNANWIQRDAAGRDYCNGVIGAAWVIESLACIAHVLGDRKSLEIARDVFFKHPVDAQTALWHRLETNGTILSIDRTLNHQLWFASSGARLYGFGCESIGRIIRNFLDKLGDKFHTRENGLIHHRIRLNAWDHLLEPGQPVHIGYTVYSKIRRPRTKLLRGLQRDQGYHAYNLHALSVLFHYFPDHKFWRHPEFQRALGYLRSIDFSRGNVWRNPYSFGYNPVGFEAAFALQTFYPDTEKDQLYWIKRQFAEPAGSTREYGDNSDDPFTARARLYEATELHTIYPQDPST